MFYRERIIVPIILLVCFVVVSESRKQGTCPPVFYSSVCTYTCLSDYECPGRMKCCKTVCGGSVCSGGVPGRRTNVEKTGACPSKPKGHWVCSSRCATDRDCSGIKKCCKNRCGAMACMKPEINDLSTSK